MTVIDIEVILLVIVPAFPATALGIMLWRRAWFTDSPSLRERTLIAARDWVVASIAATLALSRLGLIAIPNGSALPLLLTAMLLVSVPSAWWLWLYSRGRFR